MLLSLIIPDVADTAPRKYRCPYCNGIAHIHSRNSHRQITDLRLSEIEQIRYRCIKCAKTFQSYPQGMCKGAQRSDRVKALGVVLVVLGLSYRKSASVVKPLAGKTCASTVYNDVQAAGAKAQHWHRRLSGKVRVVGVDGTGQKMKPGNEGIIFAVDQERQVLIRVEVMEEADEKKVKRFLKELSQQCNMEVLITDEHNSYRGGAKGLAVEHRLCEAHWKKAKVRRARNLAERAQKRRWRQAAGDLEQLVSIVRGWRDGGEEDVKELWQKYLKYRAPRPGGRWSFGYEIRLLMQDVLENWKQVGPTNNTTERLIGLLLKMRSKVMRGFAKPENIKKFVYLNGFLWAHRDACNLSVLFN